MKEKRGLLSIGLHNGKDQIRDHDLQRNARKSSSTSDIYEPLRPIGRQCEYSKERVQKVLNRNFSRLRNRCEIDLLVPTVQFIGKPGKLLKLCLCKRKPDEMDMFSETGGNDLTEMFHVEHLLESAEEVKMRDGKSGQEFGEEQISSRAQR